MDLGTSKQITFNRTRITQIRRIYADFTKKKINKFDEMGSIML